MDLLPNAEANYISFFNKISIRSQVIYSIIVLLIIGSISLLPCIKVEVGVNSTGLLRPSLERTEIKSPVSGLFDSVLIRDGESVLKNQMLFRMQDSSLLVRKQRVDDQVTLVSSHIVDLQALLQTPAHRLTAKSVRTVMYQHQLVNMLSQLRHQYIIKNKIDLELKVNEQLYEQKIIAAKELYDKQNEKDGHEAFEQTLIRDQLSRWAVELSAKKDLLRQLEAERNAIRKSESFLNIRSPAAGVIQMHEPRYPGSYINAGETICLVSPDTVLIVETYVASSEIGLLKTGTHCVIKVDAFHHHRFGVLTGEILSIDQDYTVSDNRPLFRIKCRLHTDALRSTKGTTVQARKGMSVQLRFLVAERTLWQLLYDNIDDWFNARPSST